MAKRDLANALKTDVSDLAQIVRSKGRGRDTILAHITPREARKLKREGGRGSTNPETGLLEFEDGFDFTPSFTEFPMSIDYSAAQAPAQLSQVPETAYQAPSTGYEGPSSYGFYNYTPTGDTGSFQASYDGGGYYGNTYQAPTGGGDYYVGAAPGQYAGGTGAISSVRPGTAAARSTATEQPYQPRDLDQFISDQEDAIRRVGELEAARGETAKTGEKSFLDKLTADPLKLALALGGGALGMYGQSQAKKQAEAMAAAISKIGGEQKALAQPFLQQGGLQYGLSTQGALTPAAQQQFDAARAQLAQASARSGSVGAMQATQIAEQIRQQTLASQMTQAMQILSQGNTMMNAGLQTDIAAINARSSMAGQASQAMMNVYGALGKFIGG
jgi:hypothetical protein